MEVGSGNVALLHCICLHAYLAASSNLLRRYLNNTCITISRGVWRYGRGPIGGRSDELGGFWSKPSVKKKLRQKPHKRWLELAKYCHLLDWIRAKWLRIENEKKIVPVSEKVRRDPWGFRQQGWPTPTESGINDGERRPVASPGFCVRGHRFGVVKRPKIIHACRTVYSWVCVIALGLTCVPFTYDNKIKLHDSLKNYRYRVLTKSSADADKPARRVWRPVKVTKHSTFYMLCMLS